MSNIYKNNFKYSFYLISYKYSKQRKYRKPIIKIDSIVLRCDNLDKIIDDPDFQDHKERLFNNLKHFNNKLNK